MVAVHRRWRRIRDRESRLRRCHEAAPASLHGQACIADGAITGYLDGAHYLKITCAAGERLRALAAHPILTLAPGPAYDFP
jgi:hypothetical protein